MKSSRRPSMVIAVLALWGLNGCSSSSSADPKTIGLVQRDTFVQVLTEVHLIEGVKKQRLMRNDDEGAIILQHYAELFDRFGIDEERFKTTYQWWYQHPVEMDGILEDVGERLADMEREANRKD
jgi:hypothetical protein